MSYNPQLGTPGQYGRKQRRRASRRRAAQPWQTAVVVALSLLVVALLISFIASVRGLLPAADARLSPRANSGKETGTSAPSSALPVPPPPVLAPSSVDKECVPTGQWKEVRLGSEFTSCAFAEMLGDKYELGMPLAFTMTDPLTSADVDMRCVDDDEGRFDCEGDRGLRVQLVADEEAWEEYVNRPVTVTRTATAEPVPSVPNFEWSPEEPVELDQSEFQPEPSEEPSRSVEETSTVPTPPQRLELEDFVPLMPRQ